MMLPRARNDHLVIKQVADETLVYDLERHRAYCLNAAAGLIWDQCDGRTDADQMAAVLQSKLGLPRDEAVVQLGLAGLERAHLLVERLAPALLAARYSRRKFLVKAGVVGLAVLLPTVISIVSPTAAQAATCIANNGCAGINNFPPCGPPNCTKICCLGKCRNPAHADCAGA